MKKSLLILPLIFIFFSFLIAPQALAQCYCYCPDSNGTYNIYKGPISETTCKGATYCGTSSGICGAEPANSGNKGGQAALTDPLGLKGDLTELYARVIQALLGFVGVASLVTFVYAGFMFLTSAGNQERVKKAKDTMLYGIIGVAVAIASYAILSFIFSTLETATGQ